MTKLCKGRNDTRFMQMVGNLKSHDTLTKTGWVNYQRVGRNELWTITSRGLQYLRAMVHNLLFSSLPSITLPLHEHRDVCHSMRIVSKGKFHDE